MKTKPTKLASLITYHTITKHTTSLSPPPTPTPNLGERIVCVHVCVCVCMCEARLGKNMPSAFPNIINATLQKRNK